MKSADKWKKQINKQNENTANAIFKLSKSLSYET